MKKTFLTRLSITMLITSLASLTFSLSNSYADCLPAYDAKILRKEKEIAFYAALSPFSLVNIPFVAYKSASLFKIKKARNLIAQAQTGRGAELEASYQELMIAMHSGSGYSALSEVDLADLDLKGFAQLIREADQSNFFCYGKKLVKYSEIIDSVRNGKIKRYLGQSFD